MNASNSNSISQQHGQFTAAEAEDMLFTASDVYFEEDISSNSDSECLETPSLEESLEEKEEDESEQGQQIMVEVEGPASPISAVTEADVAKTATQDQGPSVIAFNHRRRPKKMVTTLDKNLDENNYDMLDLNSLTKKECEVFMQTGKKKNEGKTIRWSNSRICTAGRQNAANIISGNTGVKTEYRSILDSRKAWELFFTPDMLSLSVMYTNIKLTSVRTKFLARSSNHSYDSCMKNTTASEILAFIGLMYLRGLLVWTNHDVNILFNDLSGHRIFGATMSKNRFKFLFAHISFDDHTTRPQRWLYDNCVAIRNIFESFNENCSSCIIPDDFLSPDETLYPMRNKIDFRQYNPNKPAKYGLLFKSP